MRALAIVCYLLSASAELIGIGLIVAEVRHSQVTLVRWRQANPTGDSGGSYAQLRLVNEIVSGLLGNRRRRILSVVLLVAGLLFGTVGNFASLPS
jgi:hypothetical protein